MPNYIEPIPKFKGDKKPRINILKLAQKITDRIGHKVTVEDPEYWGLACIVTDEMADVALKMKVRKPYLIEDLSKKCKKDEKELEKLLLEMAHVGLVEYNYENKENKRQWVLPMFVPGSAEFTNMNKEQMDEHPELARFFERMTFLPLEKVTAMVPEGGAGIGMHVIPVEQAISMENKSINIEHISYWLKKYEGKLSLGLCSCRYGKKKLGEGCADDAEDWCIGVGDMARYCVETGKGHYATYEEVMDVLKRAEDNGFVHQITNIDGEDKIFAICNCNVNVCNALRTSQLFNTPNMSRSAYVAHVDPTNCVACGRCVEYCPAGAVKLGQKLCTKNGPIVYSKHELPDNHKWGKDKWDVNYRDNNRINCYETGTAPCKTACPAHIAVQGYIKLASMGKYKEALTLIKKRNPFPAICGRVCNRRCEDACTRGKIDEAVAIDDIKKFIAECDLNADTRYIPTPVIASNKGKWKEKIAIIGGGPAGLSCAYYLATMGYKPTVFEKHDKLGGMLRYGIPSYKLEKDVIDAEIDVIKELGVDFRLGVKVGKDITIQQLREEGYKAFYIAIGCQGGKLPGIEGDQLPECDVAVSFLYKYNCGGFEPVDDVVVIGGGNVAIDSARVAKRSGCKNVTMVSLEKKDEIPGIASLKDTLNDGVILTDGYGPKEILSENGHVTGVVFKKCLSVKDEDGHFNPKYDKNNTITIPCKKVIFAIGQAIIWGDLLKGEEISYVHGNYPKADPLTFQTKVEDIFVGGDCFTGPRFAIDAIALGHSAAESLHRYVQNASLTIGRNREDFIMLDKDNINIESYDNTNRTYLGIDEFIEDKFKDAHKTFTEEDLKRETKRCLGCGASVVDPNKCIGCGICTTKCEFDAIHLSRDLPKCSTMVKSEDKFKAILPYMLKREMKIIFKKKDK